MSKIHKLTLALIEAEVFLPEDYQRAKARAAQDLAAIAVRVGAAVKVNGDWDYKDHAAAISEAIWNQVCFEDKATAKAVAEVLEGYGLLNGYSCPRGLFAGLERFREEVAA